MRGKASYFFWSTAFSAAMLIYSTMTGGVGKLLHTIQDVKAHGAAGLPVAVRENIPVYFHEYLPQVLKKKIPVQIWENIDRMGRNGHYDPEDYREYANQQPGRIEGPGGSPNGEQGRDLASAQTNAQLNSQSRDKSTNPLGAKSGLAGQLKKVPVVESRSASREDIVTGQYVEIDGQYYKKSPDNVYYVKKQKIFFQDNRRLARRENADVGANIVTDVSASGTQNGDQPSPGVPDKMPTSGDEMLQILKKAEASQKAQADQLKQLEQEK